MRYYLSEIAKICGGQLYGKDMEVRDVVTDSRSSAFSDGAMFVAMCGLNHDSHAYLADMYRMGLRAFMVERYDAQTMPSDAGYVEVGRSIDALQSLAAEHRARFRGRVVAVTGSNGKTMVKEWIARALPEGVALSLLMIEGDEDIAIIEAGISQRGEMARLERMIRPEVVVMTTIGDAHQSNFASIEEKVAEKLVLAKGAQTLIYHSDYEQIAQAVESLSCAKVDAADQSVGQISVCNDALREDAQLVMALGGVLGFDNLRLSFSDVAMRLEVKEGIESSTIINDSYNTDINSLALALDTLRSVALGGKTIAVVSDILQSGMAEEELYERVASLVEHAGVDHLIAVGSRITQYADKFRCRKSLYKDTQELMRSILREDINGKTILLKGNRESHFERVCHMLELKSHTTVLEINLDAMTHNVGYFRKFLPMNHRLVAMVKAHSYGTGDIEVAQHMQRLGINYLAVAFADEGVILRERGVKMPIVVLNADSGSFDKMISYSLEPEIYSFHSLRDFVDSVERYGAYGYPVHLKLDTGMHRLGFVEEEIEELISEVKACRAVRVASVFAHLSCADDPAQDDFTRSQIAKFDRMSTQIANALPYNIIRHTANSAAIERFPEAKFDMCRLGLGLYGYGYCHNEELQPVATLKTRIVQIRSRKAGEAIGYGRSEVLLRDSQIATIPVGYADGLDRHLSGGHWSMLVAGHRAPIVGRICMDSCMIDVTDVEGVKEGDQVVIFSPTKGNTLEDMAEKLGTISYEIMTSISARVKRIYVRE